MALELNITSCQTNGCKLLTITDVTGLYNASTNPGGWMQTNYNLNDVTQAVLEITDPGGNFYFIDIINDLGFDYPTATYDTLEYEIPNTLLGLASDEPLADGIYKVVYNIYIDTLIEPFQYSATVERRFAVMCNISCDIQDLIKRIPEQYNCNKCNTDFINQVFLCYTLYKAAENAAFCGSESEFTNIMDSLKILINNTKYEL